MNLKILFSRRTFGNLSKFNRKISSLEQPSCYYKNASIASSSPTCSSIYSPANKYQGYGFFHLNLNFNRFIHSAQETILNDRCSDDLEDGSEEDGDMSEFLSRFVWIMRGKLCEAYPDSDKKTIDGMLVIIVQKVVSELEKSDNFVGQMIGADAATPSEDFSEELWRTVLEVSNVVLADMEKARKKEKMKGFLQSEEVKEMCRFAGEIGIRGDILRELRFKWAREKMEESDFYQRMERLVEEEAEALAQEQIKSEAGAMGEEEQIVNVDDDGNAAEEKPKVVTLPKRHGKIKYKIYGLDLSDPKWAEVADKIHETGEIIWPQEPKPISGKCKLVTEKILSLQVEDDPSSLLAEWMELLQPSRIDWIALLEKLKERNTGLHFKIAEIVLDEESFQTSIRDYSKLIGVHAKENRLEDAERILKKMNERGILPDILTLTILVHMYSKAGNSDRAKEAFENLRSQKFHPDVKMYNSMIMAYVNAGQPKWGESLMREMGARDIKITEEIFMALLRSFVETGDNKGAQRIANSMQFAGFEPSLESSTLLVEAFGRDGDLDQARHYFDYMINLGLKPDDRCTASMISAYVEKNYLDKALELLLKLQKDGFQPGVATYTVLVDWLGKLQLIDEAEQLLDKIAELGEAPPFNLHVSLCDMYARAKDEKKTLQALGVIEAKNDQLEQKEYERIVNALTAGGFLQDAQRIRKLMEAQGFAASEPLDVSFGASRAVSYLANKKQSMR